jgi:hypothetical protein
MGQARDFAECPPLLRSMLVKSGWPKTASAAPPLVMAEAAEKRRTRLSLLTTTNTLPVAESVQMSVGPLKREADALPPPVVVKLSAPSTRVAAWPSAQGVGAAAALLSPQVRASAQAERCGVKEKCSMRGF